MSFFDVQSNSLSMMIVILIIIIFAIIFVTFVNLCNTNTDTHKSSSVTKINDSSLVKEEFSNKDKMTFTFYHAPWCGHCKQFMPTWKELKNEIGDDGNIKLIEVNSDLQPDVIKNKNIQSFPTLILESADNTSYVCNGPRDKDSIIKFLKNSSK